MNMLNLKLFARYLLIAGLVTWSIVGNAQDQKTFSISMKLNEETGQFAGQMIASSQDGSPVVYTTPASNGLGQAPGAVLVRVERVSSPLNAYKIAVDSNGDADLKNDSSQVVTPNSSIVVRVNRRVSAKQMSLPYTIMYSSDPDQNGKLRDRFLWLPHYRAEGRLKTRNCDALLVLMDLTSDGQFDSDDLAKGTSIGLDRNGDKNIRGKDEYLSGNQIIEYCNESFLVNSMALDGSSITLERTTLRVPKIGEQLPAFSLTSLDGTTIEAASLKTKIYLIDFWASWCKPCVEKFAHVKRLGEEFGSEVSIIAVNVDQQDRLDMAKQIVKTYDLKWPQVMSGRGETDPIWKMFGGMEGNRLSIPLYVVVDTDGRLRYAGNGGDELNELRAEINRLRPKN